MALFEGLTKRLQQISAKMRGKARVTEADIKEMTREIRLALLEADVHISVVKELCTLISERCRGVEVMESLTPGQQVVKVVQEALIEILDIGERKLKVNPSGFTVIMLYGLQGSGKTTTAAKLAKHLKEKGKKPMLCSLDTHRPAAALQLDILAKQIQIPCYIHPEEKDALVIAQEALDRARYLLLDTLIVDTAGRMTVDAELMQELRGIADIVQPMEKLLIVDAMIGQEAVNVALEFEREIGLDGFIMTKLDGDARGGAALSIAKMTKKPVKFIANGERVDALDVYYPDRMASRILGMGDVLSLIEKAGRQLDEKQAMESLERLKQNRFTMDDMLKQFEQVERMGSIKDMLELLPGVGGKVKAQVDTEQADQMMRRSKAIIQSMTAQERRNPEVLNASRRKRIAQGSGTSIQDINRLIKQYNDALKLFKQFGGVKGKKGRGLLGRLGGLGGFGGFGA